MSTREEWLTKAAEKLGALISERSNLSVPPTRLSVGWPGGGRGKLKTLGECWKPSVTKDALSHIFINPTLDDSLRVLDVLLHELAHAVVNMHYPEARGHGAEFTRIVRAVGLQGKPTATVAGEELTAYLQSLIDDGLGEYPHSAIKVTEGQKKQATRMLKVACLNYECETFDPDKGRGYGLRTTAKWLDAFGPPICVCGVGMERV